MPESHGVAVPGVEVRRSPIQGVGMFATRAFATGQRIWPVIEGELLAGVDLSDPPEGADYRHDYRPEGTVILPNPHGLFNHSCDPNAYDAWEPNGTRWKVARRAIGPGEEITNDYSLNSWGDTVWRCECGAARCRREIHSDFFHLPFEIQVEYAPLLADWFIAAFRPQAEALHRQAGLPLPG